MPLITSSPYREPPVVFVGIDVPTTAISPNSVNSDLVDISSFSNGTLALVVYSLSDNQIMTPPAGWNIVFQTNNNNGGGSTMYGWRRVKQPGDTTFNFTISATVGLIRWLTGFGSATTAAQNGFFAPATFNTTVTYPATAVDLNEGEMLFRYGQWSSSGGGTPTGGFPPGGHTQQGGLEIASHSSQFASGVCLKLDDQTAGSKGGFSHNIDTNGYDIAVNVAIKP